MLHQLTWAEGEWAAVRARLKGGIFMRPRNGAVSPKQTSGAILMFGGLTYLARSVWFTLGVWFRGLVSGFNSFLFFELLGGFL